MKYKLIKEYPGSPKLGFITDRTMYFPEYYPSFWKPIIEKDYEILSLVASERNPQHKKGSKFLHNKDYKFKNMYPTEFWDIYSVKRISDNKIFTIGDFYEDLIIEKMFMSVAGDILTTYKPKVKQPLFTTEDGVDIFEGDYSYGVHNSKFDIVAIKHVNTVYVTDNFIEFSTKEKAEEYILMNKPCLSLKEIKETTTIKGLSLKKLEKLVKQKYNSPCKL